MINFRKYIVKVVLLFVLIGGSVTPVQAASSLGNFCWTTSGGEDFIKLFLIDTGDGDFLANGRVNNPGHFTEPLIGSGFVDGSSVRFTLQGTGGDSSGYSTAYTVRVVLSTSTLNGNIHIFNLNREGTDPDPNGAHPWFDSDTLTNVSCTQP